MNNVALPTHTMPESISLMDTDALRRELAKSLAITAEQLAYLAQIWRELERRGEDLSDLRAGLAVYLPRIAAGHLDAGVVVKFAGFKTLLNAISTLPISEQRRLADGGTVTVVLPGADGELCEQQKPAHALTAAQVKQVFDIARLRSKNEQIDWIDTQQKILPARMLPTSSKKIRVDRKTGDLKIGHSKITSSEIIRALSDIYSEDVTIPAGAETKAMVAHFTDEERRTLRVKAAEAGLSIQDLIRTALKAQGLLN